MKKCNLKRAAKRFIKEIGGRISFEAVKRYLIFNGYEVIFYNSDEIGDELLKKYNLYDYALTKMAFTLRKNSRKLYSSMQPIRINCVQLFTNQHMQFLSI